MRVTIHQPNFFPWLGLFDKAAMVDTFVVLDHVQVPGGPSWLSRNRLLVAGRPHWLTMPIHRAGQWPQRIADVRIQWENRIVSKHLPLLRANYGKHAFFDETFELVERAYAGRDAFIADFNLGVIKEVCGRLGLEPEFVHSSRLVQADPRLDELRGNELLVALCAAIGATDYVSGAGCLDFIEPPAFAARGISFWFQRFHHPEYPQLRSEPFASHLSVLDALFNVGFERVRELIRGHACELVAAASAP